MSYHVLGRVSKRFDEADNLLKRQVAAGKYIEMLDAGYEVFNFDESILRTTDSRKRGWALPKNKLLISHAKRLSQVSMIATASSKGRVFFAINKGKNTSVTFRLFMVKVLALLDADDTGWRSYLTTQVSTSPRNQCSFTKKRT
jgi:hypothetical protein